MKNGSGELIFYERPNTEGPKLSEYVKLELKENSACVGLKDILSKTNGILGVVEKLRHLYLIGQSRIHIDQVENLGHYMEIEVFIIFILAYLQPACCLSTSWVPI